MSDLASDEVHSWCARLDVPAETSARLYATLSADERARAARLRFERDRQRFIVARGVLRDLLARYLHAEPGDLSFAYGAAGKPELGPEVAATLRFNLSHSEGAALIAVTRAANVGVDIECIRSLPDAAEIAQRFFSDAEIQSLSSVPAERYAEAFFSCWTRKEAYLKACGDGLTVPLRDFSVPVTTNPSEGPLELHLGTSWSLYTLQPLQGYVGALAIEGSGWRLRQREWTGPGSGEGS